MRKILVSFLAATLLFAQSERANLTGTVSDPSGAPVAGVTINVIDLATNTTATVRTTAGATTMRRTCPQDGIAWKYPRRVSSALCKRT